MNTDLLKRLCETPGIPGREERVRDLIISEVKGLFDDITTDPMGNLMCRRDPRGRRTSSKKKSTAKKKSSGARPKKVMLACHMDEIGFYVKAIDDKGFIRIQPAGGFDPRNMFSRRVLVCTKGGDIVGSMNPGGRPIHISSAEERSKVPEVKDFFIDIGLPAADVKRKVRVGDMIVWHEPFEEVGHKVMSKALDNRIACWLGIESVRALEKSGVAHSCELHCVFTVQEEVGLRGARTAGSAIEPDIALGLDTTLACDTPGVPSEESVTKQGDGAVLHVMDSSIISDHELINDLEAVAKKKRIKVQRSILPRGGQDGGAMQQAMKGCRAAGLSVGTRYIHSVTEMIHKSDLEAARDLVAAWIPTVK